jgi:hypothetical protein
VIGFIIFLVYKVNPNRNFRYPKFRVIFFGACVIFVAKDIAYLCYTNRFVTEIILFPNTQGKGLIGCSAHLAHASPVH